MRIRKETGNIKDSNRARIFDISEFSIDDGPGKRIVVYFQGCKIHCTWCHSPHSQLDKSPLLFNRNLCKKCKRCVTACPHNVHRFEGNKHIVDRTLCRQCGIYIAQCPCSIEGVNGSALHLPTITTSISNLYHQIEPYIHIVRKNGGITLSGGEALLQFEAAKELLIECIKHDYHTAVETSGLLPISLYSQIQPFVKLWLFGIRVTTGNNVSHFAHIDKVLHYLIQEKATILPRIPMVPGVFDKDEILIQIKELLNKYSIDTVCLLPWNKDFNHYYEKADIPLEIDAPAQIEVEVCENKIITFFKNNNFRLYENR